MRRIRKKDFLTFFICCLIASSRRVRRLAAPLLIMSAPAVAGAAPVLEKLTLSLATVEVSSRQLRPLAVLKFDGPLNLPVSGTFQFTGPGGDSFEVPIYESSLSSPPSSTVVNDLAIPLHRAPGEWTFSVRLTDGSGVTRSYGAAGDPPLPPGSTTKLTLSNAGTVDLTPPLLTSASITPDPVDVTVADRMATLTLSAADDTGIHKIYVALEGPTGVRWNFPVNAANRISGTAQAGVYQEQLPFPSFLKPETLAIRYTLEDTSGRRREYGPGALAYPVDVKSSIVLANRGLVDEDPPELTSFRTDATVIDTADAAKSVQVQATFSDPVAGLSYAAVGLYNQSTGTLAALTAFDSSGEGPQTTPVQTSTAFVIPRHTPSGIYYWKAEAYDSKGRVAFFDEQSGNLSFPPGANNILIISNSGPVEALPEVAAISADLATVDVSVAPREVHLSMSLLDTVPGLKKASLALLGADGKEVGSQVLFTHPDPESAPVTPVPVNTTFLVPQYLKPGLYAWSIRVEDGGGNFQVYGSVGGPAWPAGFSGLLTVVNNGPVANGSVLLSVSSNQMEVDVTSGPATLEFSTSAQDVLTGLWYAQLMLITPSGGTIGNWSWIYGWEPGSPALTSAMAATETLTLGARLPPGDYQWRLRLLDIQGRETVYGGPGGAAFPGDFSGILRIVNTGAVDTEGPVLDSLRIIPEVLTAADLPAPVLFEVKLRDPSGVAAAEARLVLIGGRTPLAIPLTLTSGTPQDGTWSANSNIVGNLYTGSRGVAVITRDQGGYYSYYGNRDRSESAPYRGILSRSLPVLSTQHWIIAPTKLDAFSTWLRSWSNRPELDSGPSSGALGDPDGDGLPNALEFLCGTDPLLPSRPGGTDPSSSRAPVYTLTPFHLRVDYQISAANTGLGTGNPFTLRPQSSTDLAPMWNSLTPSMGAGDHWWAEVPISGTPRQFLRMAVFR